MINKLIQVSYSKIGVETTNTVNSRDIYAYLELAEGKHNRWFESVVDKYGFIEGEDYISMDMNVRGVLITNYITTIDMAKELCMVSNTNKGKEVRKYFLLVEKKLSAPKSLEQQMKDVILLADRKIQELQLQIEVDKPLTDFGKAISQSAASVKIGDWIKAINDNGDISIGRNRAFKWLRTNKYLTFDNRPMQRYLDQGLFDVKEGLIITDTKQIATFTTLLTGKGQMYFAKKLKEELINE